MYYIVFLLGIFLSIFRKKILFKIFFFILLVFAFLRYGVGSDYFSYQFLYSRLNESFIGEFYYGIDSQEIGFRLFGSLLKSFGFSYQQFLVVIAAINLYFIYKTCKKYSKNPTMSLVLYYCFYFLVWTFSGLRQGITIAVGVYFLLEHIQKNNPLRFTIIVLLLSLFHTSALILLPLYIVCRVDFKKKNLIILAILSVLFSIVPIGKILLNLSWIPFINRIITYIDTSPSLTNVLDFQSLGRIAFLFIVLFFYDIYIKQDDLSKKIINIYVISLILYFVFKFSEATAARLSIYGKVLDIIILTNIYYIYRDKINKLIYLFLLLLLCTLYLNKELTALERQTQINYDNSIMLPYTNIYNKDNYYFNNKYLDLFD